MPTHSEHITAVLNAFNAADWDRMREFVPDSAVYHEPATGRTLQGDAFVEALQGWRAAFPDVTGELTSVAESGDIAVAEITWTGTHDGTLVTPGGEIPASGKPQSTAAAWVGHYDGDTVVRTNHYFDMLGLLQQIGAV